MRKHEFQARVRLPDVHVHGNEGAVGHDGDDGGEAEGGVPGADVAHGARGRLAREPAHLVRLELQLKEVVQQGEEAWGRAGEKTIAMWREDQKVNNTFSYDTVCFSTQ